MKRFLFGCGTRSAAGSCALLLLRIGCGGMMALGHGWPKAAAFAELKDGWFVPGFLGFLSPPASLALTIGAELVAASLLVLGLLTRPAALGLAFTMAVAAFAAQADAPWFIGPGVQAAKEPALLYLTACLTLLLAGAGGWSLDALIHQPGTRRR
jgi:putative oxidoreductase